MTTPARTIARRPLAVRVWWSLTAVALVLGVGSMFVGEAGAQKESSGSTVTVDRVDATGDVVVADGSVTGADPSSLELSSSGQGLEDGRGLPGAQRAAHDVHGDGSPVHATSVTAGAERTGPGGARSV